VRLAERARIGRSSDPGAVSESEVRANLQHFTAEIAAAFGRS
jgi:hypothetical protein